jgi:hypothetical protein
VLISGKIILKKVLKKFSELFLGEKLFFFFGGGGVGREFFICINHIGSPHLKEQNANCLSQIRGRELLFAPPKITKLPSPAF